MIKVAKTSWFAPRAILRFAALCLGAAATLSAQTLTKWDGSNSTDWSKNPNWTNGVPNATNMVAVFDSAWTTTANAANIGSASYTIGGIRISSTVPATDINIGGSTGTLTLTPTGWSGTNGIDNQSTRSETIGAKLALGSAQTWTTSSASGGNLSVTNTVNLNANTLTLNSANAGSNIGLSGAVSGTGGVTVNSTGTATLSGTAANTYSGATNVNAGTLVLNKTAGVDATGSGALTVGDGSGAAASARLDANHQIGDAVAVTVNSDGTLNLNGKTETISTVAGAGTLALGTGGLTLAGTGSTTFSGLVTGTGSITKASTSTGTTTLSNNSLNLGGDVTVNGGTLEFSGTGPIIAGSLTLGSGSTLRLTGSNLTVGSIHITGNTVIDFGSSSSSILNTTSFIIDAGVTLVSIINWVNASDYFSANAWTGATLGTRGQGSELQVTFSGYSNTATGWMSYDSQITPAPEPATYGLVFSALASLLVAVKKRRFFQGSLTGV